MTTYYVKSGTGGSDDGSSLANAAESIAGLMAAQALVGGDVILVDKAHSYSAGAAITWTLPETGTGMVAVICVDTGASNVSDTGAQENTNGNFAFTIGPSTGVTTAGLYVQGVAISAGAGGSVTSADIILSTVGFYVFEIIAAHLLLTN